MTRDCPLHCQCLACRFTDISEAIFTHAEQQTIMAEVMRDFPPHVVGAFFGVKYPD